MSWPSLTYTSFVGQTECKATLLAHLLFLKDVAVEYWKGFKD